MEVQMLYANKSLPAASPVLGDQQEQLVDHLHGPLYHTTRQGRVFSQTTTPLGVAIPIYTATAPLGNAIWNPIGSGVKCVLLDYTWQYVSGAGVNFGLGLMARNGCGSVIGTGQQITAFAETTPVNGRMGLVNAVAGTGGGETSKVKSSNAGTITITAGVAGEFVQAMGFVNQLLSASAQGTVSGLHVFDFKGRVHVYPGTMVWVTANLASVALLAQTIAWEEIDLAVSA